MIKVAVLKLTSCSGCITEIITALTSDVQLAREIEFVCFPELGFYDATGRYDVVLVEGSVTSDEQKELVKAARSRSEVLVAVGTCATLGGVQSLRAYMDAESMISQTYRGRLKHSYYQAPLPVDEVVEVNCYLPGCPVKAEAVRDLLQKLTIGGFPVRVIESVCGDCKRRGNACVLLELGEPCLGPITVGGCGALCPSRGRGCYGCYGLRVQDLSSENFENFARKVGFERVAPLLRAFGYKYAKKLGV